MKRTALNTFAVYYELKDPVRISVNNSGTTISYKTISWAKPKARQFSSSNKHGGSESILVIREAMANVP